MRSNKNILSIACATALLGACSVSAGNFDIEETRTLTLDTSKLKVVSIDASSGFLKVKGIEGSDQIRVVAELKVNEGEFELVLEESGDSAKLKTEVGDGSWLGESPIINLTVEMPKQLMLTIKDGSGSIEVTSINNSVSIKDGSGSIDVRDIKGDLTVNDGSGSFTAVNIEGALTMDDGSGSIDLKAVTGPVEIEDGSGGINIENITNTLKIDDGSGSIYVKDVKGHVTIDDGSGSINLIQLENGVTILEEGSGGLSMRDVKGEVNKRD